MVVKQGRHGHGPGEVDSKSGPPIVILNKAQAQLKSVWSCSLPFIAMADSRQPKGVFSISALNLYVPSRVSYTLFLFSKSTIARGSIVGTRHWDIVSAFIIS